MIFVNLLQNRKDYIKKDFIFLIYIHLVMYGYKLYAILCKYIKVKDVMKHEIGSSFLVFKVGNLKH